MQSSILKIQSEQDLSGSIWICAIFFNLNKEQKLKVAPKESCFNEIKPL